MVGYVLWLERRVESTRGIVLYIDNFRFNADNSVGFCIGPDWLDIPASKVKGIRKWYSGSKGLNELRTLKG